MVIAGNATQERTTMKVDRPPSIPSRSRKDVEDRNVTLFVVSTNNHDDDVSLLSFDQDFPSSSSQKDDNPRFGRFSSMNKGCDVSPMPPKRRLGSSARSLQSARLTDLIHTTDVSSNTSSPSESSSTTPSPTVSSHTSSSPSNSSCTRFSPSESSSTRSSSKESVSFQLDSLLDMVNNLGVQLSDMHKPNQSSESQAQEEIRLLREQLEEERRARENIEKKLTVERDIATTIRAQLALKTAVNAMTQHVQLIQQDRRETTRAREALMDVVGEIGEGRWKPISYHSRQHATSRSTSQSKKTSQNSTCYTIPELESVPSDYDSSSLSRSSSSSHGSAPASTKGRKSTKSDKSSRHNSNSSSE